MLLRFAWLLFSMKWPGLPFTFGQAFIAVILSSSALTLYLKLFGFSLPRIRSSTGGNNNNIRVSDDRKGDEK